MSFRQAVDDVKKLTRMLQSLNDICAALEGIDSIEQAERDARARMDAARRDEAEVKAKVDGKVEQLNAMNARIADAERTAERIVADANAKATEALQKLGEEIQTERQRQAGEQDFVRQQVDAAKEMLVNVNKEVHAARDTLAAIYTQIAAAKALISGFTNA